MKGAPQAKLPRKKCKPLGSADAPWDLGPADAPWDLGPAGAPWDLGSTDAPFQNSTDFRTQRIQRIPELHVPPIYTHPRPGGAVTEAVGRSRADSAAVQRTSRLELREWGLDPLADRDAPRPYSSVQMGQIPLDQSQQRSAYAPDREAR